MSKEKQIEELAEILRKVCAATPTGKCMSKLCCACRAETVIEAGYRKQSDVIDEFAKRLKEAPIKCKLPWLGLSTKEEIEECIDGIAKEMKGGK